LTRGAEDRVRDEGMRNGIRSELHRDPGDGRVPEGLGYRQCCHHAPGSRSGRNWRRSHRSEPADRGHPAVDLAAECLSHTSMRPVADRSGPAAQSALPTSTPDLNCGPRIGRHTTTSFGGSGFRRLIARYRWRVPLLHP
jgi:hypothetical protein